MDEKKSRIDQDVRLVERCLQQEANAWQTLRDGLHEPLRSILIARGATPTEAIDLLGDLWADCLGGHNGQQEGLLHKYHGRCALVTWLATVATHRLVDLKRRQKFSGTLPAAQSAMRDGAEASGMADPFTAVAAPEPDREPTDAPLLALMRQALTKAMKQCPPEERIMLQLVYLEKVSQRSVARMWGWNESKVSRALDAAMRQIRTRALQEIRAADPWLELSWTDFLQLCESSSAPVFG